jgi:tRNA(Ile)-lysidine synthase
VQVLTEAGGAPIDAAEFDRLLSPLGPFGAAPRLAAAVSGGADSTALTLLAADWAGARGGAVLALVVDHGLRPESGAEAVLTLRRLAVRGIAGRLLPLAGLRRGPGLAERARQARYAALEQACREAGIVHLLLGHHAADQAETIEMRRRSGSGRAGLAGMAAIVETDSARLLRPLLGIAPARLRATLRAAGMAWVEDPSNGDPATLRARLRAEPRNGNHDVADATLRFARAETDRAVAAVLAERAAIHPEGFAVLSPGPLAATALAALLQAIAGSAYAPSPRQVAALAAEPRPATIGGVRLMPAGRLGPGLLLAREPAMLAPPLPAAPGARWDGRFRLDARATPPQGAMLGALGAAAARLRDRSRLPAAVLCTLPALWLGERLFAVPHLAYPEPETCRDLPLTFCPRRPAAGAPWRPPQAAPSLPTSAA